MALKILLADDSMTAQNLGKKILSDAGYDVVAVSNGAAAVKKIATEKPAVIILDVYMPGYSGLEVCEKVKASAETATIPVLLTVGKMEPFQPEDGNRVKADGVMIKPFEASDLLAAVERFAKKVPAKAQATPEKTQKLPVMEDFKDESYEAWKSEAPVEASTPPTKQVAMSAEMAASPAFGFDEEERSPAAPLDFSTMTVTPDHGAPVAPASAFGMSAESTPASSFEIRPDTGTAPAFDMSPVPEPAPTFDMAPNAPEPAPSFGLVSDDSTPTAEISIPAELEYNAAPPVEVAAVTAPELEPSGVVTPPEVPIPVDPALVTNTDEAMTAFTVKVGMENPEPVPVGIVSSEPDEEAAAEAVTPEIVEQTEPEVDPEPAEEQFVPSASATSLEEEMRRAFSSLPSESRHAAAAAASAGAASTSQPVDVSSLAAATGFDENRVAEALDRVMERFKGQLVSEIVRELKK